MTGKMRHTTQILEGIFIFLFLWPAKTEDIFNATDVVTVKVLVIFDYQNTLSLKASNMDSEKYASIYWDSVQQSFFQTKYPRIELSVTGVLTLNNSNEEPFTIIKQESPKVPDEGYFSLFITKIDETSTLDQLGRWLHTKRASLPSFDVAFLHTRHNVGSIDADGFWHDNIPGGVKEGDDICNHEDEEQFRNVAVVEDVAPRYVNVIVAVQMVATLLGVPFDGSDDAGECSAEDAYLMGMPRVQENSRKFSTCSLKKLQDSASTLLCLRNTSAGVQKYSVFDHINLSLHDVCRTLYGENSTSSPMPPYLECNVGLCSTNPSVDHPYYFHPPEGIGCSKGKVCVHGVCVQRSTLTQKDGIH